MSRFDFSDYHHTVIGFHGTSLEVPLVDSAEKIPFSVARFASYVATSFQLVDTSFQSCSVQRELLENNHSRDPHTIVVFTTA